MALTLRTRLVLLAGLMALASSAAAQDWTQWRGPNRDGVVPSFREPATWPDALTKHWELDVGLGYASPILVGDRLYLHTRQGEDEIVQALDAASGDLLWRQSYPAPFEMNPFTARHGAGPKSTPTFADGRLFTFGKSGIGPRSRPRPVACCGRPRHRRCSRSTMRPCHRSSTATSSSCTSAEMTTAH